MMSFITKLRLHNRAILLAIIFMATASIVLNFISAAYARNLFYIASYISIISIIINLKKRPDTILILLVATLFLIGLSKYLWFCLEYIGNPQYNKYNPYFNTGKRLLLSAVIAWSLFSLEEYIKQSDKKLIKIAMASAFIIASAVGIYQSVNYPNARLDFFLGYATDSAYMYSAICIFVIIQLEKNKAIISKIAGAVCFVIAFYVLFKTGTRNVLICFPLILLICLTLWKENFIRKASIVLTAIIIAAVIGYKPFIEPRITATTNEITNYTQHDGNRFGSFTARLAMWDVGYHAFKSHPWGMSFEEREKFAKDYTDKTNSNKSALHFMDIHLHNELIDTASLQGILGILVMLASYISLLYFACKNKDNLFLGITLIIISVGFTDVIFISREQSIFFPLVLILATLMERQCLRKEQ